MSMKDCFQSVISSQPCSSSFPSLQKIPIIFIVGVTGKSQATSHSPTGLPRMLAPLALSPTLGSNFRSWALGRNTEGEKTGKERGEAKREESVRWRFEGGNELPASTTLVMTRLPCLSLSSLRRSFPSVIPRQWSHLKPPARRQNDSLDSLLNEMLHFPILLNFPKIEALYFSFTAECNTRCFGTNRLLSSGSNSHVAPSLLSFFDENVILLPSPMLFERSIYQRYLLMWFISLFL